MKKIDKCAMLRRKMQKANNAFYNYQNDDIKKLADMALVAELLYEDVQTLTPCDIGPNQDELFDYMMNIYKHDICLVLKIGNKIHGYTRHQVASRCRATEMHMGKTPSSLIPLKQFMEEVTKAEVLFFIGLQFIGTPFIRGVKPVTDSSHFYREFYYNRKKEKIPVTVIESLMLNIYEEIGIVIRQGKFGWRILKSVFGFDEQSTIRELGSSGQNIVDQIDKWKRWNQMATDLKRQNKTGVDN